MFIFEVEPSYQSSVLKYIYANKQFLIRKDNDDLHLWASHMFKDEDNNFYLICICSDKRLNMKSLREILKVKPLHFASPEELKHELNLTPGSVSLFGMINASRVELIIDSDLWSASSVCFHPNINTETIEIDHTNLEIFVNSLTCKKRILKL